MHLRALRPLPGQSNQPNASYTFVLASCRPRPNVDHTPVYAITPQCPLLSVVPLPLLPHTSPFLPPKPPLLTTHRQGHAVIAALPGHLVWLTEVPIARQAHPLIHLRALHRAPGATRDLQAPTQHIITGSHKSGSIAYSMLWLPARPDLAQPLLLHIGIQPWLTVCQVLPE